MANSTNLIKLISILLNSKSTFQETLNVLICELSETDFRKFNKEELIILKSFLLELSILDNLPIKAALSEIERLLSPEDNNDGGGTPTPPRPSGSGRKY